MLSAYLRRGSVSSRDAAEAAALLEHGEARRFPTHAGTPLESALYLVRVGLTVVGLLAAGDPAAAEQRLTDALLAGGMEAAVAEPFDGLLFRVGEKVAYELGDETVAARMAAGARLAAARRSREADALRDLLGMPGGNEGPPEN